MAISQNLWDRFRAAIHPGSNADPEGDPYLQVYAYPGSLAIAGSVNIGGSVNAAEVHGTNATVNVVAGGTGAVVLMVGNSGRKSLSIFNDSPANLYVAYGQSATIGASPTLSRYSVRMTPSAYYEVPFPPFTGTLTGVWDGPSGALQLTETY